MYFDSTVLSYQNIRLAGVLSGQTVLPSITGNRVNVAYLDFSGVGLRVCADTLFWIDFAYSAQGGLSPLVWDDSYTSVSGPGGVRLTDVRLGNGLVYGAGVNTPVPTSNGDQSVCEFADAVFAISGTGISSYQWMVSTDGGSSFVNLINGAGVQGAQSDTLRLASVVAGMDGNKYMCRVQGSGGMTASLVQRLRVRAAKAFTPNSQFPRYKTAIFPASAAALISVVSQASESPAAAPPALRPITNRPVATTVSSEIPQPDAGIPMS